MVTVRVPATTANLGPGFDSMGMAMGLYNYVTLCERPQGLLVEIDGESADVLPRTSDNVVVQAVNKVFATAEVPVRGLYIKLKNEIPICRGLGSSAAAVVGGLVAANEFLDRPLSHNELLKLAVGFEGHPDNVTPALFGGIVIAAMDDDQVIYRVLPPPTGLVLVVAIPQYRLPTSKAREILPAQVPVADAVFNLSHTGLLVVALLTGDWDLLGWCMQDRLHQPYRKPLIPGMEAVFRAALRAGAKAAALSGAGPSLVAFCYQETKNVGQAMQAALAESGIACECLELRPEGRGAQVIA